MQGPEPAKGPELQYLRSTVQSNGKCERRQCRQGEWVERSGRINLCGETGGEAWQELFVWWNGGRRAAEVICDWQVPASVKGKVCMTVVRPAMLCGLIVLGQWH